MLTIKDIIKKEITAAGTSSSCIYGLGYIPGISTAWLHPGGLYALFLTEEEAREFELDVKYFDVRARWMEEAWNSARICEECRSRSLILGGKRRKLWFNDSRDVGEGHNYAMANTLFSRLKISNCVIFQATIKPYGYFLVSENGRPYAYIMPIRLALAQKEEV